jgi:transcriptional regulator with XRE-family HTH domain
MVDSMFTPAAAELVRALVAMRKAAGLTQRELAEAVGREQNYIGRIETGQRRVDLVELIRLCRACGRQPEAEIPELTKQIVGLVPQVRRRRGRKRA